MGRGKVGKWKQQERRLNKVAGASSSKGLLVFGFCPKAWGAMGGC